MSVIVRKIISKGVTVLSNQYLNACTCTYMPTVSTVLSSPCWVLALI